MIPTAAIVVRWGPPSAGARPAPAAELNWPELRPDRELEHWPQLLRRLAELHRQGRPVLLLAAPVQLAAGATERLLALAGSIAGSQTLANSQAGSAQPTLVLATLNANEPEFSPLPPGRCLDAGTGIATSDSLCAWLGHGLLFDWHEPPLHAGLWLPGSAEILMQADWRPDQPLPPQVRSLIAASVLAADPAHPWRGPEPWQRNQIPPPIRPLDAMRVRWPDVEVAPAGCAPEPGRPVVLHVCHGWGGGSARFIRDLAGADDERCHLLLSAHGATPRQQFGEWLELRPAATPELLLARYPLSPVIADSSADHSIYGQVLDDVLEHWQVDAVIVSSLIGHDLAALATGLPTLVVCHDYFPLWPELHCDFGDPDRRFDRTELERDLARSPATLFAEHDVGYWWRLRQRFIEIVRQHRCGLVAPTRQVQDNWLRMAPELSELDWQVIGHGLPAWPAQPPANEPPPGRARLRILVPGRIAGGKGMALLQPLAERLDRRCELLLLGAGHEGQQLLGYPGVHLLFDYRQEQLPALVADLRPDLALLPATVAETFGYLLSELQSLGLPVLATAIGSYGERIRDGVDGLLTAPDVDAILRRLAELVENPAPLVQIRAQLAQTPPRSASAMAQDYRRLLPIAGERGHRAATPPISAVGLVRAGLERSLWEAERNNTLMLARLDETEAELERRAEWGFTVTGQLRERTEWALSLEQDLDQARKHHVADIERLSADIASLQQAHDEELHRIYSSRSWRAMAPMRWLARKLRGARARARFQLCRIANLMHRLRLSLATRGLAGTIGHLRRRGRGTGVGPEGVLPVATPTSTQPPEQVPDSERPLVSIIIPIHGKLAYTCACLASLAEHALGPPFEIIVVDDCSPDDSAEALASVRGLHLLRNEENLGFVGSCNAGAAIARGSWLVFLNNDTTVTAGWLGALLDSHRDFDQLGLVGARLVYPDGRLQEAGGLVFSDGSGWNYGRYEDPADPRYGYARECDYCSGAAILIEQALFTRLGGFDERYAPAYYEDTDLAFKVRAAGLKVICQPAATVVHHEGVTSGTDTGSGIKRHQVINQVTFKARWSQALERQPAPGTPVESIVRSAPHGRILVIDATTPQPDQDSGSVRLSHVLRLLRESGRHVTFFADNRAYVPGYTEALQRLGIEVLYHPWLGDPVAWLREHGPQLDAVMVCRHYIATNYLDLVRQYAPRARFIFDTVDLHYLREERAAALAGSDDIARQAARTRSQEQRLIRASDVTLVVSPVEQELLRRELPGARVEVLSNVHPVLGCRRSWAQRQDLFFVGGFQHPPNIDAVAWFCTEVFPLVRSELPDVRFHVIGSRITPQVQALAGAGVEIHGHVPDLEPYLDGCRIALAPLRYGAGVKGKVNMSMSYGQPVVATRIAVEGMHLVPEQEVLVADDAAGFAAAVVRLYRNEALWNRLSAAGIDNVRRHFSFDAARAALARVLAR